VSSLKALLISHTLENQDNIKGAIMSTLILISWEIGKKSPLMSQTLTLWRITIK